MIRGTTPRHQFALPFNTDVIKCIEIVYSQDGANKVIKKTEDCTMGNSAVMVRLTQEETLQFEEDNCVEVQIRVLTTAGDALASHIMRVRCEDCLSDEVLK